MTGASIEFYTFMEEIGRCEKLTTFETNMELREKKIVVELQNKDKWIFIFPFHKILYDY